LPSNGAKNICIHSVKGGKLQREQKKLSTNFKGEGGWRGKKNCLPIEEENIVGHQKKTKRPLIAKEMKLEGKKCPPILEERENLEKKIQEWDLLKNSIVQLDPWLWCSRYEHLS
jgi:hypothetical protein